MAGMYNNFWWLGNILAGWTTYGTNYHLKSSWAWRIPTIVQAGMPAVVMCLILFFPESPRWLIAHDRPEEALAIFAKYHGDGDPNSAIPQLQYHEIVEENKLTRDENPWWDFRELVHTRAARYRLAMVIGMAFIGQCEWFLLIQVLGNLYIACFLLCDIPHCWAKVVYGGRACTGIPSSACHEVCTP